MIEWFPLSDTRWLDGRDLVLLYRGMEVQGRFCKGIWSNHFEYGREYDGAVWSCVDDEITIEIEELGEVENWYHPQVTHWRDLSPRPIGFANQPSD
jgi:hypothetical protein